MRYSSVGAFFVCRVNLFTETAGVSPARATLVEPR
jgi:hypothetical protein